MTSIELLGVLFLIVVIITALSGSSEEKLLEDIKNELRKQTEQREYLEEELKKKIKKEAKRKK